jgi:DNA-binding beta-propeller fold protein YncE
MKNQLQTIKKYLNSNRNFRLHLFIALITATTLNSCSNKISKTAAKPVIVYPNPPEQARIQYLTKITSSADLGKKQGAFSKFILGVEKPNIMVKPYGIAIHKGKMYVCDYYGGGMEIIDLEKKTLDFFQPAGRGKLKTPINCFVDDKGYLYVADPGRREIVIFDENGNFVRSFGSSEKFKPSDVNVFDDKIFVANIQEGKVNVYSKDSTNKLLYKIPDIEPGNPGFLCSPSNIAIKHNRVYAADFGCSQIKIYGLDGTFIDSIGSLGDLPGQFSKLKGIAVDNDSNVFAVDAAFENVQIFNDEGKLLLVIGGHYAGPGGLYIPAKVIIDYDNMKYFEKYLDPAFELKYLIFVTSQYGPDLINVYGRIEPKSTTNR